MPRLKAFQRALAERRGEVGAALFAAKAHARYEQLYPTRPRFGSRALRDHFEGTILPALALYQTLLEEKGDREAALAEVDAVFARALSSPDWQIRSLSLLPDPFPAFRVAARLRMRLGFPPEGWRMEVVQDDDRAYAFDVRSCFYLATLESYGAPELTYLFCKCDDRYFAALPPSIVWHREGTLALGRDRCDFRYERAETGSGRG